MSFQDFDFKSDRAYLARPRNPVSIQPSFQLKLPLKLLLVATVVSLLGFSVSNWQPTAKAADSTPKSARLHYSLPLPAREISLEQDIVEAAASIEPSLWETVTIKSGDTLAAIFSKQGISSSTTHQIATLNEQTRKLRYIQPGEKIEMLLDEHKQLRKMKYIPDITRTLVIMDLVSIFGWDIDFSLDIRKGDRFGIVYEELYKDDVKIRNGRILSAEFINDGKTYRAVYYTDPSGDSDYYSPDGKSMRKAFLRSPVEFSRISSRFSNKRWHPVLSKWRSHKGVDYAAARGTPIRASGDGKVSFAGRKGGYGRLVVLQHGGRYTSAYGHLHRYAKGVRSGKKVKQGQIIGYVGSSGLASGPHLHYEFRVNGVHRNPLTVKLPEARPVNAAYLSNFNENTQVYLSMLRLMDRSLAANSQ